MTFPTAKLDPRHWVAADATERDAIGSNDSLRVGDLCELLDGGEFICASVDGANSSTWTGESTFTDGTRGSAGTAGRVIFNSTDGNLNIDDGTNWILPDGTTT